MRPNGKYVYENMSHIVCQQRNVNINTAEKNPYTPDRMAEVQTTDSTKIYQGCGVTGTFIHGWWDS